MEVVKPSSQQEGSYTPDNLPPIVFENYSGALQTNSTRPGIKDEECWWLDGWFFVGPNYIRTLYGLGPKLYQAPASLTIPFFDFYNLAAIPYMVVFLSDGSIVQVNTTTGMQTQIAPTGTILNPSRANCGISQWGSQYLLIVAKQTNGYWIWDGTNFYGTGTLGPSVTMDNSGADYTSQPTMTAIGGTGSGATFFADIQNGGINNITVTNPGSGYSVNDFVYIAFSGGGSAFSTAIAAATLTGGTLSSVSVTNPGYGYSSSVTAQVLGGGGTGAQVVVTASDLTVSSISVSAGGLGYTSNPTIFIEDPNNPVAVAVVSIMPFGVSGTCIETYNSQVWIGNGRLLQFSAPGSVSDFATDDGAGLVPNTNSFQRVGYIALKQSNGFLYLISDSSVDYISGVQTSGTPATTTFTYQNADPEIGTPYPSTVQVFSRNILFANAFGAQVSFGGAVTKISENLDGIYNTVPNFGGVALSSGKAIIFGKKVWVLLVPVIDIITGQQVNKLFIWNSKQWCSTQQDVPLTFIQSQEINSVMTCYGTDGTSIYPLFQQPSTAITKTVQSKLWAKPAPYSHAKSADRLWYLAQYFNDEAPTISISIDNETSSDANDYEFGVNALAWQNQNGALDWQNANGALAWENIGTGIVVSEPVSIAQNGALLGFTATTSAADMALISMMVAPQVEQYRG